MNKSILKYIIFLLLIILLLIILFFTFSNRWKTGSSNESSSNATTQGDCIDEGQILQIADSQQRQCCSGLNPVVFCLRDAEANDGSCSCPSRSTQICINCGDGICGTGEDLCTCPDDCLGE